MSLSLAAYERDGFVRLEEFVDPAIGEHMLARVIELAHAAADGHDISPAFVMPESQAGFVTDDASPEDLVSKIFRLARDPVFHEFATSQQVVDVVTEVLGTDDIDCFLSQFIFKNPGAWGQPWHQDSHYFPFDPARPIVGIWLAITDATLENGCLHVVAGSHRGPVHTHVPDRRPNANDGYTEIVDQDTSASTPVLMHAGDLLVFDSHLMHRSTDNETDGIRAAMVYHYARAGSVDLTEQIQGVHDQRLAAGAEGVMIIAGANELDVVLRRDGDRLYISPDALRDAIGWELKPEGLCRGDVCVPTQSYSDLVDASGDIDLAVFANAMGRASAIDAAYGVAVLGEASSDRQALAADRTAPAFELPDLDGNPVALEDYAGKKRVIATWASWCGCRYDLPAWQALQQELPDVQILSISLDNTPDAAREFAEAADAEFPVLIDANHTVAEQYGLYNVPSVVWIDEEGKVARSPVIAPGDDTWRDFTSIDSSVHHDQLRTWVASGEVPDDDAAVQKHMANESPELQTARAERRLGAWLARTGQDDAAARHFERAIALAPLDFTIVRGSMPLRGKDPFGEEFFAFMDDWDKAGRPGGYTSADGTF